MGSLGDATYQTYYRDIDLRGFYRGDYLAQSTNTVASLNDGTSNIMAYSEACNAEVGGNNGKVEGGFAFGAASSMGTPLACPQRISTSDRSVYQSGSASHTCTRGLLLRKVIMSWSLLQHSCRPIRRLVNIRKPMVPCPVLQWRDSSGGEMTIDLTDCQ